MKCPNCLYIMECVSAINPVPGQPGRDRMDLHCVNKLWPGGRGCSRRCHMGVITEDPKPWVCLEYGFGFKHKDKRYILTSHDEAVDEFHQYIVREQTTKLYICGGSPYNNILLYELPFFISISTGDDMHEEAWSLFHRLRDLAIYS